jgi:hypothetical protein
MCPVAHADGHNFPGHVDELVPGEAAVVKKVLVACEDAVGDPLVARVFHDSFTGPDLSPRRRPVSTREILSIHHRRHDQGAYDHIFILVEECGLMVYLFNRPSRKEKYPCLTLFICIVS